jgi:hypothetical protein
MYHFASSPVPDYAVTCIPASIVEAPQIVPGAMPYTNTYVWNGLDEMMPGELEDSVMNNEPVPLISHQDTVDPFLSLVLQHALDDLPPMVEIDLPQDLTPAPLVLTAPLEKKPRHPSLAMKEVRSCSGDFAAGPSRQEAGSSSGVGSNPRLLKWECHISANARPRAVGRTRGDMTNKKALGRRGCLKPESARKARDMRHIRACLSCRLLKVPVSVLELGRLSLLNGCSSAREVMCVTSAIASVSSFSHCPPNFV